LEIVIITAPIGAAAAAEPQQLKCAGAGRAKNAAVGAVYR
jgi:hypothetical protein